MLEEKIDLHQRFLDVFTDEELEDIIENAMVITENCIMINTKDYFFELSSDIRDKLDIFCYNSINSSEGKLTKIEFIKLYKSSLLMEMQHINIDD